MIYSIYAAETQETFPDASPLKSPQELVKPKSVFESTLEKIQERLSAIEVQLKIIEQELKVIAEKLKSIEKALIALEISLLKNDIIRVEHLKEEKEKSTKHIENNMVQIKENIKQIEKLMAEIDEGLKKGEELRGEWKKRNEQRAKTCGANLEALDEGDDSSEEDCAYFEKVGAIAKENNERLEQAKDLGKKNAEPSEQIERFSAENEERSEQIKKLDSENKMRTEKMMRVIGEHFKEEEKPYNNPSDLFYDELLERFFIEQENADDIKETVALWCKITLICCEESELRSKTTIEALSNLFTLYMQQHEILVRGFIEKEEQLALSAIISENPMASMKRMSQKFCDLVSTFAAELTDKFKDSPIIAELKEAQGELEQEQLNFTNGLVPVIVMALAQRMQKDVPLAITETANQTAPNKNQERKISPDLTGTTVMENFPEKGKKMTVTFDKGAIVKAFIEKIKD